MKFNRKPVFGKVSRIIAILGLAIISCQKPPVIRLDNAKAALRLAEEAGALRYAEEHYRRAEDLIKTGWLEMAHQQGRLAPFRNFNKADSILILAAETALEAHKMTVQLLASLDSLARAEHTGLGQEIKTWREALDGSLDNFKAEKHWTSAELAMQMGENLIRKGEYEAALESIRKGRNDLRKLESAVAEYADDEARKIGVWRRWVRQTLDKSRASGTYAVIVDKSAHKAYLVKGGELIHSYPCELGYNSAQQKLFAGDGATPEGTYNVTKVKKVSKYHRALLIDYPNQNDLARLRDNKARGIISRNARPGALIEIHGEGGRNRDWTEGCVALTNNDIEHLMKYASVGMPVTIVRKSDLWP